MKIRFILLLLILSLMLCGCEFQTSQVEYGFAREVSAEEQAARMALVSAAEGWLGCNQGDSTHKAIVDLYNSHEPLAQGYLVTYTDQWCAVFVSASAIQCGYTDIIPTECGCQRQIGLFDEIGCWQEDDAYVPLPGDIIYYATSASGIGDCTEWSNHVGIVVGTSGDRIKVIEGNFNRSVRYNYISVDDSTIRGYGLPDYTSK